MEEDDDKFYTELELERALEALTTEDIISLRQFARFKLTFDGLTLDEDDLVQEAVKRSLEGVRRWNKNLTIRQHLIGVMRSISSDVRRSSATHEVPLDPEAEDLGQDVDNEVEAQDLVRKMFKWFESDGEALIVLHDMLEDFDRSESVQTSGLTVKEYNAARKRIVREMIRRKDRGDI